jgi:hypothetical protein
MPLFRVYQPVELDIQVEAQDGAGALLAIEDAFKRPDPLHSPNVRIQVHSSLRVVRAQVLDATPQGPARLSS